MSSYYEALPIFRAAMDTAVRVDAAVQRFPKGHRYTLGNKLRELSAEVLVLVARANSRSERTQGQRRRGARYGVLWRYAHRLIERIVRAGHPVAVALEEPALAGQVKRRRLAYLFEPIPTATVNHERTPS